MNNNNNNYVLTLQEQADLFYRVLYARKCGLDFIAIPCALCVTNDGKNSKAPAEKGSIFSKTARSIPFAPSELAKAVMKHPNFADVVDMDLINQALENRCDSIEDVKESKEELKKDIPRLAKGSAIQCTSCRSKTLNADGFCNRHRKNADAAASKIVLKKKKKGRSPLPASLADTDPSDYSMSQCTDALHYIKHKDWKSDSAKRKAFKFVNQRIATLAAEAANDVDDEDEDEDIFA